MAHITMGSLEEAVQALIHVHNTVIQGMHIRVSFSKSPRNTHTKDDRSEGAQLTKDFTGSPLHRFKRPGSKNSTNIFEPSTTLHISNIGEGATEAEIQEPFREHGTVLMFKFFNDNRKMAHITMGSLEEAVQALIHVHNTVIQGMHIRVSFSKSPRNTHTKNINL